MLVVGQSFTTLSHNGYCTHSTQNSDPFAGWVSRWEGGNLGRLKAEGYLTASTDTVFNTSSTTAEPPCAGTAEPAWVSEADLLVAFDFDETIIPCNSDTEVPRLLDLALFNAKMQEWRALCAAHEGPGHPCWTTFMDSVFAALARKGHTPDDLGRTLATITIDPHLVAALRLLKGLDNAGPSSVAKPSSSVPRRSVTAVVISDANDWFIDEVHFTPHVASTSVV